jgi:hypothetical protein
LTPPDATKDITFDGESPFDEADVAVVYRYLYKYSERIGKDINHRGNVMSSPTGSESSGDVYLNGLMKRCHEKLFFLFDKLGQPVEQQRNEILSGKTGESSANNRLYAEFMTKNENRNVDVVREKKIFYKGEKSLVRFHTNGWMSLFLIPWFFRKGDQCCIT